MYAIVLLEHWLCRLIKETPCRAQRCTANTHKGVVLCGLETDTNHEDHESHIQKCFTCRFIACLCDFGGKQVTSPNTWCHVTSAYDIVKCWKYPRLPSEPDRGHGDLPHWWPCGNWCNGYAFSNNSRAWSSWCCRERRAGSNFGQTRYETVVNTNPVLFPDPRLSPRTEHCPCRGIKNVGSLLSVTGSQLLAACSLSSSHR